MSIAKTRQPAPVPNHEPEGFVKRSPASSLYEQAGIERRQFPNVGVELSVDAEELGQAIDLYKFENKRKRINVEELVEIMRSLGYVQVD